MHFKKIPGNSYARLKFESCLVYKEIAEKSDQWFCIRSEQKFTGVAVGDSSRRQPGIQKGRGCQRREKRSEHKARECSL